MPIPPKFPNQKPPQGKGPQVLTARVRAEELRLIDGEDTRIVSRAEAEQLAEERGLDLVIVSLDSSPPVVRLVDYGKFKFEAEKKAKEAKKKQHVIDIKEIKMGIRIDKHDYETKKNHGIKFLTEGNKVKVTIRLKGRETQHAELAFALANRFVLDLEDCATLDGSVRKEGRTLTINLSPKKPKTAEKPAPAKAAAPRATAAEPAAATPSAPVPEPVVTEPAPAPEAEPTPVAETEMPATPAKE